MQPYLLAGLLVGVLGGLVWLFEDDEKQKHREGIAAEQWKAGRDKVRAAMDGRPEWLRRLHRRWSAAGRLGEAKRLQ